jgi:two-component system sensor histidine kinase VicK
LAKSFFKKLPRRYGAEYRNYYTLQNLVAVRTCSLLFFILNVCIRVLCWIFPESLTKAENFPAFNYTNWIFIGITPFFLFSSYLLTRYYRVKRKATTLITIYVFFFAVYIITCGILSSFIATSDPSNALTLYLIPLVLIGVVCVFELYETILMIVIIEIIFTAFLDYIQVDATELVYNELISVILLCGFYLASRYFYAYKANYFKQIIEIREKNLEIELAGDFKNQVLGTVAHDLRNPIAAVESLAMMMELEDVDEDTRDNLGMIKTSCLKARTIIDDLLEVARNENANLFETQKTELNAFLRKIIDSWRFHKDKRNSLLLVSSQKPLFANINNEKFHRVIDNLLSNAIKFSKDDDKIEIRLSKVFDYVVIEIKDYGLGIPKNSLPYIFDRFSKAGRIGMRGELSTGLGLSIVRQIVEKHNGTIEVESEEKKGSTFKITLPATE